MICHVVNGPPPWQKALCLFLLLSALFTFTAPTFAQTNGSCDNTAGSTTKISISETKGRAEIVVQGAPGRRDEIIHVDYDNESYAARFDNNGVARLHFALVDEVNTVTLLGGEFEGVKCHINFSHMADVYRVVLRWHEPVRVDLHVVEPTRQMEPNAYGHIYAGQQNLQLDHGLGSLDIVTDAIEAQDTGEQSYVIDESVRPKDGVFTFRRDYVTRGAVPSGEYCGAGSLANIELTLIVIDHGKKQEPKKYFTGSLPCGRPTPPAVQFRRLD